MAAPPAPHSCLPRGLPAASPAAGLWRSSSIPPTSPHTPSPVGKAGSTAPPEWEAKAAVGWRGEGGKRPPPHQLPLPPVLRQEPPSLGARGWIRHLFAEHMGSHAHFNSKFGASYPPQPPLLAGPTERTASVGIPDVASTAGIPLPQFPHVQNSLQPHWGPIWMHRKPRY